MGTPCSISPKRNEQGEHEDAIAAATKFLDQVPNEPRGPTLLYQPLMSLRRMREAEKAIRRSLVLEPNNAYSRGSLAYSLEDQGRIGESLTAPWRSTSNPLK
jgi:predicted Zn-dependent protease